MREVSLSNQDLDDILEETRGLVLVYFWAPWCGPCKRVKPMLAEVENELAGKFTALSVDIDKWANVAIDRSISSVPHFAIYLNGELQKEFSGAVQKKTMIKNLSLFL